ncbi:DUF4383 domain-containing protein [Geodermatophilus sp. YIM 151500]|uniref:DUF4383 domain-containing protein n=1 Tax=Geodermatophilus sp. YIM 151500 TaxID=2984531 RepID=UPI0021E4202F|nr:DUF4383 domain-containing protein [Geodermatophilus sp. YIM 151500]MCV2491772.1 DUF4383 domain-containing protein [Geodermatophilus sp. YIM 151500]
MALRTLTRKRATSSGADPDAAAPAPPVASTTLNRRAPTPPDSAAARAPAAEDRRPTHAGVSRWQDEPEPNGSGARVPIVHRLGAFSVAAFIFVFGVLGFVGGLDFFSTDGEEILGLSSNGLLSTISVVVAVVLVVSAFMGPRIASTVMLVIGVLFLLSALVNLAVLRTSFNFLAFEMPNVIFSIVAGLLLLTLGAYGRISGHLPADSPYAHEQHRVEDDEEPEVYPQTPEEVAAEEAMREAEIAVVQHTATDEQRRRVEAMHASTLRQERRRIWMSFDEHRTTW